MHFNLIHFLDHTFYTKHTVGLFDVLVGSVDMMEGAQDTTFSSWTSNATLPVSEYMDGVSLWLPLIVVIGFAVVVFCLVVIGHNFICMKTPTQQLITG
jgi:hypothetical protein